MDKNSPFLIDATEQPLGKLAVKVAILLQGKNDPNFLPNRPEGKEVFVSNVEKVKITGRKMEQKIYYHHSGYLGSMKETTLAVLLEKNPQEVLRKAVWGMLPKNKLRKVRINRLKFK
jgi:large subunit ribosomal protein L13